MSLEEVGAYSLLLSYDWNEGGLPDDMVPYARWLRSTPRKAQALWDAVKSNFALRDGRWYNPRLERERTKQAINSAKKAAAAAKRWHPFDDAPALHTDMHVECPPIPFASPIALTTTTSPADAVPETPRPSKPKGAPSEDEEAVALYYRAVHPKRGPADEADYKIIRRGLKSFSRDQLCRAIDGNREDEWHRARRKHELSYVFRNNGKISEFIDRHDALNAPLMQNGKLTEDGVLFFAAKAQ